MEISKEGWVLPAENDQDVLVLVYNGTDLVSMITTKNDPVSIDKIRTENSNFEILVVSVNQSPNKFVTKPVVFTEFPEL